MPDTPGGSWHPNTDHDEDYNRAHWTGEAWLGIGSMRAPRHGERREVRSGTYAAAEGRREGYMRNGKGNR